MPKVGVAVLPQSSSWKSSSFRLTVYPNAVKKQIAKEMLLPESQASKDTKKVESSDQLNDDQGGVESNQYISYEVH